MPADYDAVILGGSITPVTTSVRWSSGPSRITTALALNPSAFFSVCLTAADDTEESRAATRGYLDDFVEQHRLDAGTSTPRSPAPCSTASTTSPRAR